MKANSKPQILTIFFLTFAIISSSYGIISLLQHKGGNKLTLEETVFYQKCSNYLKGQDLGYCDIFKG